MESIILIEKTPISGQAIEFLNELNSIGGSMSRGNNKHDYLTCDQHFDKEAKRYTDQKSKWVDGRNECYNKKLIERSDNGSEYSYIRYSISERGREALRQSNGHF